jgi:hypothetical protein
MTTNVQTFGSVNGTPISGDVPSNSLMTLTTVTLGSNSYIRTPPDVWPRCDAGAAIAGSLYAAGQTTAPGAVLTLFAPEAAALVAAGAAS